MLAAIFTISRDSFFRSGSRLPFKPSPAELALHSIPAFPTVPENILEMGDNETGTDVAD